MQNSEFYTLVFRIISQLFQKSLISSTEKTLLKDQILNEDSELLKTLVLEYQSKDTKLRLIQSIRTFVEGRRAKQNQGLRKHSNSTDLGSLESIWEFDEEFEEDTNRQR